MFLTDAAFLHTVGDVSRSPLFFMKKGRYVMKDEKKRNRTTFVLSVDEETKKQFKKVAKARHMTVSGMLTAWVWAQEIPDVELDSEDEDDE